MKGRRTEGGRRPIERLVSAGGVVYRRSDHQVQVLVCGRKDPPLWALPKGTPNSGESIEQTAQREVTEETGVQVRIVEKLGSIRYWFSRPDGVRCHKVVHHFLMEPVGGDPSLHDIEFDTVAWFPVEEALRLLTYPNELAVLERAVAAITARSGTGPATRDPAELGRRG
ncbi:MAG: NUDIX hydrolase [Chloroflexi bacterium]|nr:NUDIX hydrolase [Chloroflexota bacterium]